MLDVWEHFYSKYFTDKYLMLFLEMSIVLVFCSLLQFVVDNTE